MGAAERILVRLVPEWQGQFAAKNADYSDAAPSGIEPAEVLGIKGQFAEIWRKVWKLKKAMWDGSTLAFEQPREILLDLIGHCFLAIDMIDRKSTADLFGPIQEPKQPDVVRDVHEALKSARCGTVCRPREHTFTGNCRYRIARPQ